jgi:hypothetical protein
MYEMGTAVPQDSVEAYKWFTLSGPIAVMRRTELSFKMSPDKIAEAQRLAQEWLAAHPKP